MNKYKFKLYVTGKTINSTRAIESLRVICDEYFKKNYELSIVDVLEHPQLAEDEKILATPTIIKELPPPVRRIIGDLSDKERVIAGLGIHFSTKAEQKEE